MFTGIIEELGQLKEMKLGTKESILSIQGERVLVGTRVGDSIAVNGVCLTVTKLGSDYFCADVMNETLSRSGLGDLKRGDLVNLERALSLNDRLGGHIVSGHIDGMGTIKAIKQDDNAFWYEVEAAGELLKYIVEKGSVAIDGISLTVAAVKDTSFLVSVIPHTRQETILSRKGIGNRVNLECDIIGKYVERLLGFEKGEKSANNVTRDFLLNNGFV